jgi:very-short-patch-repair endonuclease
LFRGRDSGLTDEELEWGARSGRWRRVQNGIYADGPDAVTSLDRERARVMASSSPARGALVGVLLELDSVELDGHPLRRGRVVDDSETVIGGVRCISARQALVDLAANLDDETWEQALESALRKRLVRFGDFDDLPRNVPGVRRIRRVLERRGDVPPTESLLETLMVQLIRAVGLPEPVRQYRVVTRHGTFVARIDLCWPNPGVFVELDGQGHKDQPVYDASRQTAVVVATGWHVARFTWTQVVRTPKWCARQLQEVLALAA